MAGCCDLCHIFVIYSAKKFMHYVGDRIPPPHPTNVNGVLTVTPYQALYSTQEVYIWIKPFAGIISLRVFYIHANAFTPSTWWSWP